MRWPPRYLLVREQNVGQSHRAELNFADKSVVIGLVFGMNVDMDIHIANRVAPSGVALFSRQAVRREDEIQAHLPLRTGLHQERPCAAWGLETIRAADDCLCF